MSMERSALTVAFVCVHNAGRSQMAAAFARRERDRRELTGVEVLTGGTEPADKIHSTVLTAMSEIGIDLSTAEPREISLSELQAADIVITMGCDPQAGCPAGWDAETRTWKLPDPATATVADTREIRDEIETRVQTLFGALETRLAQQEARPENN